MPLCQGQALSISNTISGFSDISIFDDDGILSNQKMLAYIE